MADPNDPTVAAYLSAIGFDDAAARAAAEKRRSDVNAQSARLVGIPGVDQGEIAYQGDVARSNINNDAAGRGVWSSGEHDLALARQAHGEQYQRSGVLMQQGQQLGDVDIELARALAADEARRQTLLAQPDATTPTVILSPAASPLYGGWGGGTANTSPFIKGVF